MTVVLDWTPVALTGGTTVYTTPRFALDPSVGRIIVSITRSTTTAPIGWGPNSTIRIDVGLHLDGVTQLCSGQATGGVLGKPTGEELAEYQLDFSPSTGLLARASVAEVDVRLTRTRGVVQTTLRLEVL